MTREERKSARPELYCTSVSITFAFEVCLWGLRYQLLCLSRSLYRDELLPGCHYGALQSPWKLHKYSITDKTSTMKSITHSFIYFFRKLSGRFFLARGDCQDSGGEGYPIYSQGFSICTTLFHHQSFFKLLGMFVPPLHMMPLHLHI